MQNMLCAKEPHLYLSSYSINTQGAGKPQVFFKQIEEGSKVIIGKPIDTHILLSDNGNIQTQAYTPPRFNKTKQDISLFFLASMQKDFHKQIKTFPYNNKISNKLYLHFC